MLPYPLTIISDRYDGTYSGGAFLAFNLETQDVPTEPQEEDIECSMFWKNNTLPIGRGSTPEAAIKDLQVRLYRSEIEILQKKISDITGKRADAMPMTQDIMYEKFLDMDIDHFIRDEERLFLPDPCAVRLGGRGTSMVLNALIGAKIFSVRELLAQTRTELKKLHGLGNKSFDFIEWLLRRESERHGRDIFLGCLPKHNDK